MTARRLRCRRRLGLMVAVSACAGSPALADDVFWTLGPNSTGFWSVGSNWSSGSIPAPADTARYATAGTFVTTLSATQSAGAISVSAGGVTIRSTTSSGRGLNLITGPADLLVSGGATLSFGGAGAAVNPMAVAVGDSVAVGEGSLIFEDAGTTLVSTGATSTHLIADAGHSATMTIRDGAVVDLQGSVNLASAAGAGTHATLDLQSGAKLDVQRLNVATVVGAADATINVGSQLTVHDALVLGNSGTSGSAKLNLTTGGSVTLQTTGHVVNATGQILQTGGTFNGGAGLDVVGGRIDVSGGTFSFGASSTLSAGARVTLTNTPLNTDGGTITVTGSNTRLDTSQFNVNGGAVTFANGAHGGLGGLSLGTGGGSAVSSFNVNSGASVDVTSGDLTLNLAALTINGSVRQTGTGAFRVDGITSAQGVATVDGGTLETGTGPATIGAYGRVSLINNGTWTTHGNLTVDGGTLDGTAGKLLPASGTTLTIRNGGSALLPALNATGATLAVTGGTSAASLGGTLGSSSTLNVVAGGKVTVSSSLTLDRSTGTVGDNVATPSRIDVTGSLAVHGSGSKLTIGPGGTVDLADPINEPGLIVDEGAIVSEAGGRLAIGEHTSLVITDASSLLADGGSMTLAGDSSATVQTASTFRIGGTLTMSDAASVELQDSTLQATSLKMRAGTINATGGNLTITGSNAAAVIGSLVSPARVTVAANHIARFDVPLLIGDDASPTVNILGGATVTVSTDNVTIGTTEGSAPIVELADARTTLSAPLGNIGLGGHATVHVANGATLSAGGIVQIDHAATLWLDGGSVIADALFGSPTTGSSGTLNWTRGTLRLRSATTLATGTLLGGTVDVATDRSLVIDSSLTIPTGTTLRLSGGSVDVGSLDRSGAFIWTAGSLRVGNTLHVGGSSGAGSLGDLLTLGLTQSLRSSTRLTVATGGLLALNGGSATAAAIDVQAGGEVLLDSPVSQFVADGAAAIDNAGLIHGDGIIGSLSNAGELRAENQKRVRCNSTIRNSGRIVLDGGTVDAVGMIANSTTGTITGRGAIFASSINNAGAIAFSTGTTDVHGDLTNASGGRITVSGNADVTFWDDLANASGASLRVSPGSSATFFGTYAGGGISGGGSVFFESDLTPGFSPASITFGDDVAFSPASHLRMEIAGLVAGSQFDQVNVAGTLSLDGTIDVLPISGFQILPGQTFSLLTFADINGDATVHYGGPQRGLSFDVMRTSSSLTVTATAIGGDADLDADVDFTDLLALARHYNASNGVTWLDGDFNASGGVDFDDLLILARDYGRPASFATDWALAQALVPEPATLSALGALATLARRRVKRNTV